MIIIILNDPQILDDRPRTSHGTRPSPPKEREPAALSHVTHAPPVFHQPPVQHLQVPGARSHVSPLTGIIRRLPLFRNVSSGSVQIAIEPPVSHTAFQTASSKCTEFSPFQSQSPTTATGSSFADPMLLTPEALEHQELEEGLTTSGILDVISGDNDISYFPYGGTTPPETDDKGRSRSTTPRTGGGGRMTPRQTYDAAPTPPGFTYPQPMVHGTVPAPSTSSSSSGSSSPSPLSRKNVLRHTTKSPSLSQSGLSPATLNRPFSLFSSNAT